MFIFYFKYFYSYNERYLFMKTAQNVMSYPIAAYEKDSRNKSN